jgi:hypothetical protein
MVQGISTSYCFVTPVLEPDMVQGISTLEKPSWIQGSQMRVGADGATVNVLNFITIFFTI